MRDEATLRSDLAATFQLIYRLGMHESVANHLSVAVSEDGKQFLMNRRWMHFSNITPENLQLLHCEDEDILESEEAPDVSAWSIHGNIHRTLPDARVVLHVHSTYATALSTLRDPRILPIDNNSARFYTKVAYDMEFGGIADTEQEGVRIANLLHDKTVLLMANHGVTVIGATIPEAFEDLYYLEKACQTMILAYSTGKPLNVMSDEVAMKTEASWEAFKDAGYAHFEQLKAQL